MCRKWRWIDRYRQPNNRIAVWVPADFPMRCRAFGMTAVGGLRLCPQHTPNKERHTREREYPDAPKLSDGFAPTRVSFSGLSARTHRAASPEARWESVAPPSAEITHRRTRGAMDPRDEREDDIW